MAKYWVNTTLEITVDVTFYVEAGSEDEVRELIEEQLGEIKQSVTVTVDCDDFEVNPVEHQDYQFKRMEEEED